MLVCIPCAQYSFCVRAPETHKQNGCNMSEAITFADTIVLKPKETTSNEDEFVDPDGVSDEETTTSQASTETFKSNDGGATPRSPYTQCT